MWNNTAKSTCSSAEISDGEKCKPFDIDFVGTGTFQLSQFDLLQKRTVELKKSTEARLSARGLHHRTRNHFNREVKDYSAIIQQTLRQGARNSKADNKSLPYMMSSHFNRGISYERLGQIDKAIQDFTQCIKMDVNCAPAYFNRSGLYYSQGKLDAAVADLDTAIRLDPANAMYRSNRSLILRRKGAYLDAIKDTMVCRAIQIDPLVTKELIAGHNLELDSDDLFNAIPIEDPIVQALKVPKDQREQTRLDSVIDFLRNLQCFNAVASDTAILRRVALAVELNFFEMGETIADEGDLGDYLFIVLEGEMGVAQGRGDSEDNNNASRNTPMRSSASSDSVRDLLEAGTGTGASLTPAQAVSKSRTWDLTDLKIIRNVARGESFCVFDEDTVRTGGTDEYEGAVAVAVQNCTLLTLSSEEYSRVMIEYQDVLREEVRVVLDHCDVFRDWDPVSLDRLSSVVMLKPFGANVEILRAGDTVPYLCIIKRGVVKLIKAIDRPQTSNIQISEFARPDSTVGMEPPGLWVLEKNWKDSIETFDQMKGSGKVEFTVGVLGSGQVFGELSVLDPEQKSPFSVVSFTNVELYCFASSDLIALGSRFNSTTMNALDESMNHHNPPGEKIAYYFRSKFAWEKKKGKLLDKIARERQKSVPKASSNTLGYNLPKIQSRSRIIT